MTVCEPARLGARPAVLLRVVPTTVFGSSRIDFFIS